MCPAHEPTSSANAAERRLAELLEELTRRVQLGQEAALDEILARHPEHADEIRRYLPALRSLAELDASTLGGAASTAGRTEGGLGLLGDFRLLREVGRGGMGVVYEAEQLSLGRRVALKVLPFAAMLDERRLQRFKNEAHAAAVLQHPHIVPVYGVGCERGVHYYAMQLIDGCSLAEALAERAVGSAVRTSGLLPLPPGEGRGEGPGEEPSATEGQDSSRSADLNPTPAALDGRSARRTPPADTVVAAAGSTLCDPADRNRFRHIAELGIQAATALAYAHGQGVIHRDIKPSNLLIDRAGKLWVTDFGLARLQADGHELTLTGDVLGTLRYMSPEQLLGEQIVDERTDVYSLGLTLYELLAGQPACGETARERLVTQILHQDPPPLRKVDAALPRDLETIVAKALAKERDARYSTARTLADDLQRFLEQKPILARPSTRHEAVARWARRNPTVATLSALLATVLAAAAVTGGWLAYGYARTAREQAEARVAAEALLYAADMNRAKEAIDRGELQTAIELLTRNIPPAGQHDRRGFEWLYLWNLCRPGMSAASVDQNTLAVYGLAFSTDGHRFATCNWDGWAHIWDTSSLEPLRGWQAHDDAAFKVLFALNGELVTIGRDGAARVWDPETGTRLREFTMEGRELRSLALSPQGNFLALGHDERMAVDHADRPAGVVVYRFDDPSKPVASLEGLRGRVRALAFSPDGQLLAAGATGSPLQVWRTSDWRPASNPVAHTGGIWSLAFSPEGNLLATGSELLNAEGTSTLGEIKLWRVKDWTLEKHITDHRNAVEALAFLPEGTTLVSAGDSYLGIWTADRGWKGQLALMHSAEIKEMTVSPDGQCVATVSDDRAIKRWSVSELLRAGKRTNSFAGGAAESIDLAIDPRGRFVHSADLHGWVRTLDAESVEELASLQSPCSGPTSVAVSPDGRQLAVSSFPWRGPGLPDVSLPANLRVYETDSNRVLWSRGLAGDELWLGLDYSPDGRLMAVGEGSHLGIWDAARGERLQRLKVGEWGARCPRFSPDGEQCAVGNGQGVVTVFDATNWNVVGRVETGQGYVTALAYSPDGQVLATATALDTQPTARAPSDWPIELWDARTLESRGKLVGHRNVVIGLGFSPDGRRLATGGMDMRVMLWDVANGHNVLTVGQHDAWVWQARFSPDGKTLYSVGGDRTVRVWRTE